MSELIHARSDRRDFRRKLLVTVSVASLFACIYASSPADAMDSDSDRPPFWIELGGQFVNFDNHPDDFLPPFLLTTPRPPYEVVPPGSLQKEPPWSWDGSAKTTFEPAGSDWVFSAGFKYGKNSRRAQRDQRTSLPSSQFRDYNAYQYLEARSSETHAIMDFTAGKDVGLGRIGSGGTSIFSLGVRYAQFNSTSEAKIQSRPTNIISGLTFNRFYGSFVAKRNFSGIGPSLSWDGAANLIGSSTGGSISLDWGIEGAILFGRQKMSGHHATSKFNVADYSRHLAYQYSKSPSRSKQVAVPNVGGFAGVSWRYPNAKVSVGYRADFFFGAMDSGIDAAKKENVGFYGPFASVSVGLGG